MKNDSGHLEKQGEAALCQHSPFIYCESHVKQSCMSHAYMSKYMDIWRANRLLGGDFVNSQSSIMEVKGIGEKTANLFHKVDIYTVKDLIQYYPRAYDKYEKTVTIQEARLLDSAAVYGSISAPVRVVQAGRLQIVTTKIQDTQGEILPLKWYNMPFLRSTLKSGMRLIVRGRITGWGEARTMEQPELFQPAVYEEQTKYLHPVYNLTAGLSNKLVSRSMRQALDSLEEFPETLPKEILQQFQLCSYEKAVRQIHFPGAMEDFTQARKRLVFEEFFQFIIGVRQLKESIEQTRNHFAITDRYEVEQLIAHLPYTLTGAQQRTWNEIKTDMTGDRIMNRMVQGDVGSGKTIVAVLALYLTVLCRYQGVMMVPTEVLARQHYETICRLFASMQISVRTELLTGSMTAAQKREAYRKIRNQEADIIIGTHALIQEKVEYAQLALVITDEQHRFGVKQRNALSQKGITPHVLVMSATPIPRSLAIILYGELSMSVIDERPAMRLPIKNCVVDISYRPKAYSFIQRQLQQGHQAYIVCPMVEASEAMEGENVQDYREKLRACLPPSVNIGILHGKMKPAQKEQIMEAFQQGQIQVLVSTTVIEVGIDVPNATVIMIENADRFGLAQLHQLRGRVGRGHDQSYCILVNTSQSKESKRRLEILNQSNDGFWIAEEDLKLRGPGDFFGVRQSGALEFQLGDVYTDAEILKQASQAADLYIKDKVWTERMPAEIFQNF